MKSSNYIKNSNKRLSILLIVCMLFSMFSGVTNNVEAISAEPEPITIAQGANALAINDQFDSSFWNIGHDASIQSDRIQLTPAANNQKGYAYFKDSIRLSEDLSFNAKYTFDISDSDTAGADGIAFVIQGDSNTAGAEGEGMGYSDISPSIVVEIDTYYNPGIDPSGSHIAIMKNGDYRNHLASENLGNIDQDTNLYSVWVDYTAGNIKVYFAEDSTGNTTKPSEPHLDENINLKDIFGDTNDVFVGFSSATGGSYSKHEILGMFFDSKYTSSGIEGNDKYEQAPRPEAPENMTVTKTKDEALTVNPKEGKDYVFYENETDVKPIGSGSSFTIDASMNTDEKSYYYSLIENGVQSERAVIDVEIASEQVGITLNEESSEDGKFYFKDLAVKGSALQTILISFNKAVSENDEIILPDSPAGFTVSDSSKNNNYTKRINLSESVTTTDVQNYLQNVAYQLGSAEQSVQVVVTSEDVQYDTYYSIDTEHYYQYVTDKVSWTDAYDKVKGMEYMERTGYLATIMSKEEDIFVNSLSGGEVGWLGGAILKPTSDKVNALGGTDGTLLYYDGFDTNKTTDAWYWMNGPEIGTKFYASTGTRDTENKIVSTIDKLDTASEESYFNWGERASVKTDDDREPNTQIGPNEDSISETSILASKREMVLSTLSDTSLDRVSRQDTEFWWNDRPNEPTTSATWDAKGYFVEFGNLPVGESVETTVTTFAADNAMLSLPKPDAPSPITITKDINQDYIVTPESGPAYYFYENDTDTEAITTGSEFIIESNMNTHKKRYYYSVKENGIESDRAYIEVLIDDEVTDEDIGIKTSDGITNYTSGVVIDQNLEVEIKNYEKLDHATIIINDFELGDQLGFSNQDGISGSYNEDNGVLTLSGEASVEQYEDALQSISFETTATDSTQRQISFTIGKALYFDPTQHFYEFVEAEGITWQDARDAAAEKSFYGRQGYLATITTAEENDFVTEKSRGAGWLGASDANNEGVWEWVTGPENGQQFWQGDGSGEITNDLYENWYNAEPNNGDGQGDEDYLHIFGYDHKYSSWATNAIGYWNDFAAETTVDGYLVEYGGLSTDTVEKIQVTDDKIIKLSDSGNHLEVENGTGTGIYQTDSTVTIEAYTPLEGQQFKAWEIVEGDVSVNDADSMLATFEMPNETIKIRAVYEDIPTYQVVVTNGSGSDMYLENETVTITADEPTEGQRFQYWEVVSGDISLLDDHATTTTFEMSPDPVEIKAVYEDIPTYEVNIVDGSGSGDYQAGQEIEITANEDVEKGKKFVEWQITSGEVILTDDSDPSTTFIMPKESVKIEAIYSYVVMVESGKGSGDYQAGKTVTIKADEAPKGKQFKEWRVTNGDVELADHNLKETTFAMPAEAVELTAVYEAIPTYEVVVSGGSGSGDYQAGKEIEINANEDFENGEKFKEWKITSGEVTLKESSQATTTFVMPSEPITIEAIYTYSLNVMDGGGSGDYEVGEAVNIEADQDLENGKKFVEWQITSGEVTLTEVSDPSTTLIMPKESVTIEAIYSYAVMVEDGEGTGNYQAGETVTIKATEAPEGKQFKEWKVTSENVDLETSNAIETTFEMPLEAVEVMAMYEDIPTYSLTVGAGSGTGAYQAGEKVTIEALEPLEGKQFKEWKVTSENVELTDSNAIETTFTMPAEAVEVIAIYEDIPTYSLTVEDGEGTGNYQAGKTVTIKAGEAPEGKQFKEWKVIIGNVDLEDIKSEETTFTMPSEIVEVIAIYEDIPTYSVTVEDGNGTGDYQAGKTVTIEAAEAPEGQKFKEWKVISENLTLTDRGLNQISFTMPSESVTILATYEQMTEKEIMDQLNEAANALTIDIAFDFSEDDTWESITLQFLMLRVGMYETSIDWQSSKPNVIGVEGSKATTNRQEKDESVILKATISKAGYSVEKPFLLIAKSNQIAKKESESIKREATIDFDQTNSERNLIERINLYDSNNNVINKIDKIIIDKEQITKKSNEDFSVYLSDDINNLADELAVEINSAALKKVLGNLEVKTDQAIIQINKEEMESLNEDGLDLFFRVVPLRDKLSQDGIAERMLEDKSLQSVVSSINEKGNVKILGTPKEIETNYSGYKTDIILPIGEFYHEGMDLDNIQVYIEHSDGTIDIQKGTIIYENNTPTGYKFSIDKFSTFTLFEVEVADDSTTDPIDEEENPTNGMDNTEDDQDTTGGTVDNKIDQDLSNETDNTQVDKVSKDSDQSQNQQKDMNSKEENQLPLTALNMFTYLLIGVLMLGFGVAMYYFQRRRREI